MSKYTIEDAEAVGETPKGLWISASEFDENVFVPYSQIHDDSEVYRVGHDGALVVNEWFAEQRGWV